MMVARPEQWVQPMAVAGANQYTFHLEATDGPGALIKDIRENGMKVSARPGAAPGRGGQRVPRPFSSPAGGAGHQTRHRGGAAGAVGQPDRRGPGDDGGAGLRRAEVHGRHDAEGEPGVRSCRALGAGAARGDAAPPSLCALRCSG